MTCSPCAHAAEHASWPADHRGTHCRECHRSWTSRAEAHCAVCHGHFVSDGAAGLHWSRAGHRDPASVEGLYLGPDGKWSSSPDRDPEALRRRLGAARQKATITPSHGAERPANRDRVPRCQTAANTATGPRALR